MTITNSSPLAQAMATAQGKCEFCEKTGLAILPVRPAIMHPDSGAPQLPKALQPTDGDGGKPLPLQGPAAQYTGRVLRSGYLYVYDERGFWEKYWVTDYGYLMKVPVGVPLNPAFTVGREPCDKTGHKEIAACITVSDPKNAKRIWVGFSDAEWTPRVLKLHQDEAYRKRHMRVFDVKAWIGSHKVQHAQTLDTVASVVAEYAPKTKVETFGFSLHEFRSRASTKELLVQASAALGPGPGALLIIDDPAGVTADIASRLAELRHEFISKEDRVRRLSVSTAILALQEVMSKKAQDDAFAIRDQLDMDEQIMPDGMGRMMPNPYALTLPEVSKSELQKAADDSWKKYGADYDEGARASWQQQYQGEYDAYLRQTLTPLAMAHVSWMESSQMANYFDCSYDDASAEVGLVYARIFTMCLQDTQQYQPCAERYYKWISGSYLDANNLLLRAIVLNLKKERDQIAQNVTPPIPWTLIGWDNLCAGFSSLAMDSLKNKADVLTKLVLAIGGSITKLLQTAVDGPVRQGLVALGMVTQRPVVPVQFTGSFKKFRASLIRQMIKVSDIKGFSENAMQREVTQALRRLAIHGEPMNSTASVKLMVMIDQETLKGMPSGLSKSEQAKWVAGSLRTAEDIEALNLSAWKERINLDIPASTASGGARVARAVPFVGNLVAGFVQVALGVSLYQQLGAAKWENGSRLLGTVSLFAATLADTAEKVLKVVGNSKLSAGRAASLELLEVRAAFGAKVFGIAGALIGAIWDGYEAYQALGSNSSLAGAYALSMLAGIGIAVAIWFGWIFLTIAAAVLYLFAQYKISALGDDKLDTWLQRCVWGKDTANRYSNSEIEMNEFRAATGA